jgi:hypothetical protein
MSDGIETVLSIGTITCIAANLAIVTADVLKASFVVANSSEVGLPSWAIPYLATLKAAGAFGLIVGILGVHALGLTAAIGLTLFYVGAITAHVRARVWYNIAFPGTYLLLAVVALILFATTTP